MKKRFLLLVSIIFINIFLIYLGTLLYSSYTKYVIRTTVIPAGIESLIFTPLFLIGFFVTISVKKFRRFGFGFTALLISLIFFIIFHFNKSFASKGNYEGFVLRDAIISKNGYFLNIGFNMWYNSTKVPPEKCFKFDSVFVRVDNGFFGMKTMTNNIKIVESYNCSHQEIDTLNLEKSCYKIAHDLARRRCFTSAIHYYTICIELDSLNPDYYYHRGLMYMAKKKYKKAVFDFYTAGFVKYYNTNPKQIDNLKKNKLKYNVDNLFAKIQTNKLDSIKKYFNYIVDFTDFDSYNERIEVCLKMLRKEKNYTQTF